MIQTLSRYIHLFYIALRAKLRPQLKVEGPTLIMAPHPDDEVLGCGGLIASLCEAGNPPHIVIMTGGGGALRGHASISEETVITERRKLTLNSAKYLGLPESNIHFLDFTDGNISAKPTLEMERLRKIIEVLQPQNIFVPHSGEGWPDHLTTAKIVGDLKPKGVKLYEYAVWMWYYNVWKLNWRNAFKFKMTKQEHEAKLKAVEAYIRPLAPNGKPWSGVLPKAFVKANTLPLEIYFLNS